MTPPKKDHHQHKCPRCGHVWEHHDSMSKLPVRSQAFRTAHKCPNCNKPSTRKHTP